MDTDKCSRNVNFLLNFREKSQIISRKIWEISRSTSEVSEKCYGKFRKLFQKILRINSYLKFRKNFRKLQEILSLRYIIEILRIILKTFKKNWENFQLHCEEFQELFHKIFRNISKNFWKTSRNISKCFKQHYRDF